MSVDRFCFALFVGLLPLMWLPFSWLLYGVVISLVVAFWGLVRSQAMLLLLGGILAVSYSHIFYLAKDQKQRTAFKVQEQIEVTQILKQQDYQTAIVKRSNGEQLYANWQSDTPLILNAIYQAELLIKPLSARLNDGNFDRQRWYLAQGISDIVTIKNAKQVSEQLNLRTHWLYRMKQQTEPFVTQGLLLALAFGERAWLSQEHWAIFQQTTTAHLIAISGSHIVLVYLLAFWIAKMGQWVLLRFRLLQAVGFSLYFARAVGWLSALGYSYLAGFQIPTVRAMVAISLLLLIQFARRHYTPWQLWLRGVVLLIVLDPLTLLSDSFWLSVLAVASLIIWYQHFPLKRWDFVKNLQYRSVRLLLELFHLQLGIWLVFSPIQLSFFDGTSPFALVANMIVVPLYSFIVIPLILFSLLTDNLLQTWWLCHYIAEWGIHLIEPLSHHWIDLSYEHQWVLVCANLLILFSLYTFLQRLSFAYWLATILVPFTLWIGFYLQKEINKPPLVKWVNFDVGQGLAMGLIYQQQGKAKAVLYDTGVAWQGGSMAELEILPYLHRNGIDVEAIVVSHDDKDHAGGVLPLLQAYPKARLILSGKNQYNENIAEPCIAGNQWQFGKFKLEAIYPMQLVERAKNEHSCVLLVSIGQYKLLLTGDSGVAEERQYVQQVGKIDFLQVGHHGSKTSTSQTLLAHTQPTWAIISAGRWNPWEMPNSQVTQRLEQYQVQWLNTAKVGMIQVDFYENNYKIAVARDRLNPWYQQLFGNE
ncbi:MULTISPECIES: DNA internalization-related competence protein ComEC/Rec2 [Glaesserella]|uniref:DNA internalization-related competence protein ComEC/Rec2 n=1 Tax=Glaesserella australis TaxID=2094024 RepID=A0A328C429_9PAST|nr:MULTISPECIES: DNA internalization-related competence protein ComEC/Rec2 [Glaesserella]AUI67150.1 DNA internalization-related competence protein ComEC/Rec2 [Glaesserella sp. 15-184]RAL19790.1 DNA internalization-related competence protein ComEC/Rec2 [Glaesserella australis]